MFYSSRFLWYKYNVYYYVSFVLLYLCIEISVFLIIENLFVQ